jgi:hypothetical protein
MATQGLNSARFLPFPSRLRWFSEFFAWLRLAGEYYSCAGKSAMRGGRWEGSEEEGRIANLKFEISEKAKAKSRRDAGATRPRRRRRGADWKFEISERAKAKKAAHAPRPGEPGRMKAVASHRTPKRRGGLQN